MFKNLALATLLALGLGSQQVQAVDLEAWDVEQPRDICESHAEAYARSLVWAAEGVPIGEIPARVKRILAAYKLKPEYDAGRLDSAMRGYLIGVKYRGLPKKQVESLARDLKDTAIAECLLYQIDKGYVEPSEDGWRWRE